MEFLWFLEGLRTPLFDKVMQAVTYFGQELIVIAVICALYWCADKQFAYLIGFSYFSAGLCVQALKITFRIPRPWILDPAFKPVESAVAGATGYSFPSGHTQSAVSLFFPMALRLSRIWQKCLCVLCFLLIGFSRMYLGCHTPQDVLVSMAVSILLSCLVWRLRTFLIVQTTHLRLIAVILALCSLAAALYSFLLFRNGTIEAEYAADCFKAAGAGLGFAAGWYMERKYLDFRTDGFRLPGQFMKLFLGLAISFLIKECASLLLGSSVLAKMAEYFILVLWVLVIYPFLFSKLRRRTA